MDHTWNERKRWHILNEDTDFAVFKVLQNGQHMFTFKGPRGANAYAYADDLETAKNWVETLYEWHHDRPKGMAFPLQLQAA